MKRSLIFAVCIGAINSRVLAMSGTDYESAYNIAETKSFAQQAAMQRQQEERLARAARLDAYERAYAAGQPDFSGAQERQRRAEERALREERISAYGQPWQAEYKTGGERAIDRAEARRRRAQEFMRAYQEGQLQEAPEFVRPSQEVERPSAKKLEEMRKEGEAARAERQQAYTQAELAQNPEFAKKMARLNAISNLLEQELAYERAYEEEIGTPGYREEAARRERAAEKAARFEREMAYYGGSRSNLQAIRDYTNDMWRYLSTADLAGDVKARALAALARADRMFKQAWEQAGKKSVEAGRKMAEFIKAGVDALARFKSYMTQAQAPTEETSSMESPIQPPAPIQDPVQEVRMIYFVRLNNFQDRLEELLERIGATDAPLESLVRHQATISGSVTETVEKISTGPNYFFTYRRGLIPISTIEIQRNFNQQPDPESQERLLKNELNKAVNAQKHFEEVVKTMLDIEERRIKRSESLEPKWPELQEKRLAFQEKKKLWNRVLDDSERYLNVLRKYNEQVIEQLKAKE